MFKTERTAIAIHTNLGATFVSLELSCSTWLITSLSPGNGERMSKHSLKARDVAGLFGLLSKLRGRCRARTANAGQNTTEPKEKLPNGAVLPPEFFDWRLP
ncbi:hypothetical protein EV128_10630 [Rhizobium azibense]|nr:hypothetical protein EV128_10630 [Rhizobium azibense]